jgi:4'-phosphopantetheinyl transferase
MALVFNKKVNSNSELALWKITESCEELLLQLNYNVDPSVLAVNEQLKKQRICARILVNLLCKQPCIEIKYDTYNKPYIVNSNSKISISHAHNHVAVIINKVNETGVDIELIKPQVERIATRFMSKAELELLDNNKQMEQLTTFWCAKEALYKYYGKKELLFRNNIFIEPFKQNNSGNITGHIRTSYINITLPLCYEKTANYMMVYVND